MSEMWICRACLATDVDFYDVYAGGLSETLAKLTGIPLSPTDGMPPLVCALCAHLLNKFKAYRDTCLNAMQILRRLKLDNELTTDQIKSIERQQFINLKYSIALITDIRPTMPPLALSQTITVGVNDEQLKNSIMFTNNSKCDESNNIELKEDLDFECDDDIAIDEVKDESFDDYEELNSDEFDEEYNSEENHQELMSQENLSDDNAVHTDQTSCYDVPMTVNTRSRGLVNNKKAFGGKIEDKVHNYKKLIKVVPETVLKKRKVALDENDVLRSGDVSNDYEKSVIVTSEKMPIKRKVQFVDSNTCKSEEDEETAIGQHEELITRTEYFQKIRSKDNQIGNPIENLADFAKKYNVAIKYLTIDEQKKEMEDVRKQYQHMAYQCQMCYKGFSLEHAYKTHMLDHDPSAGEFPCDICGLRWKEEGVRNRHIHRTHSSRFSCRTCGKVNPDRESAREHYSRHRDAIYTCDSCQKVFTKAGKYRAHMRAAHGAAQCPACGDALAGHAALLLHMARAHRLAMQCDTCKLFFDDANALSKHLENSYGCPCSHGIRPCVICGEGFKTKEELSEHACQRHFNIKNVCLKCSISFPSLRPLQKHRKLVHADKRRSKCCPPRRGSANKPKPYMCDECGKSFGAECMLSVHKLLHTGQRPHQCPLCPDTFRLASSLKRHMLWHTDERPYHCPLCPAAFRQYIHRVGHMRIHTNEKPYVCEVCLKSFNNKSNMLAHARVVHDGQPPRRRNRR